MKLRCYLLPHIPFHFVALPSPSTMFCRNCDFSLPPPPPFCLLQCMRVRECVCLNSLLLAPLSSLSAVWGRAERAATEAPSACAPAWAAPSAWSGGARQVKRWRGRRRGSSGAGAAPPSKEAEQGPLVGIVRLVSAEGEDPRLRRVRVSPLPQAQLPRADGAKQDQQGGAPVEGPGRDKKGPGLRRGACASSCAPSRPSPPRWKRPCAPRAPTSAPSLRPRAPGDDQRPRPAHACGSWQRQRR